MDKQIKFLQHFLYGVTDGMSGIEDASQSRICQDALYSAFDAGVRIIDNRFVWLPEYQVKFQKATDEVQGYFNTAYAYCKFDGMWQ